MSEGPGEALDRVTAKARHDGHMAGLREALEIAETQDNNGTTRFTAAILRAHIRDLERPT